MPIYINNFQLSQLFLSKYFRGKNREKNKACISPNGTRQVKSHYQVTSEGGLDLDCSKLFTWHTRWQHRRLCRCSRGLLYGDVLVLLLLSFRGPNLLSVVKNWRSWRRWHRNIDFQGSRWGQI